MSLWIACAAAVGVVVCAVIIAVSAVVERPIPGLGLLKFPAIVLVIVGQAWAMAIQSARARPTLRRKRGRMDFPSLSLRTNKAVNATFAAGIVVFVISWLLLLKGGPDAPTRSCWPLDSHGVITCVSHAVYLVAGAAQQRSIAGISMAFFAGHFAMARSEVNRHRPTDTFG